MQVDQSGFEKGNFTEAELESAILELLGDGEFEYVDGSNIERELTDVLLIEDLEAFLRSRYLDAQLTEIEFGKILNRLKLLSAPSLYEANREAFRLVTEGFDFVRDDSSKLALHIDYIDFDDPTANHFKVVSQFSVRGQRVRRPDLLLFINGIPIAIIEFKSAIEEHTNIYDAWQQIHLRYARDVPNLLKYTFMSIISDGANNRLGTIFTPYEYYYSWNKANEKETVANGISSLFTLIDGALSARRMLEILRDFIFYPDESSTDTAIICRYPQFFAAKKMFTSISEELRPYGNGKGGVYFGATGSGKTYTMLYLARLLMTRNSERLQNPTVIIIVDREDLDSQTSKVFVAAKNFLHENDVRSIESRDDLASTLKNKPSGGVYITTIQKFSESIGLLSDRTNIICISDEAHRSQSGLAPNDVKTGLGVKTTYGFAKYLRESFPNATYCGVTGTPVDDTEKVFGQIVDSYTMKESTDDGITVRIAYEPRLARVVMSSEKAQQIQVFYELAAAQGSTTSSINESQRAMSAMKQIIGGKDRLRVLAEDLVSHYESLRDEKPGVVQKAMIVCFDREIAYNLLQEVLRVRPEWGLPLKASNETELSKTDLDDLVALPLINLVATQGPNDPPELFEAAGSKEYRRMLDEQFKNPNSNFKISVVVDMWITGFDVPSLAVMYIDKPLRRHTLIQTISRVNRVFEGKTKGLIVDYFGIKQQMLEALRMYDGKTGSAVEEISISMKTFRNELAALNELFVKFDSSDYFISAPLARLKCLNSAVEFIQVSSTNQERFKLSSQKMKAAYQLVVPTGEITGSEISRAQFYLAIRSILLKQTRGDSLDAESMNRTVEKMVEDSITTTGVESIIDYDKSSDLFGSDMLEQLQQIELPITKFNALVKLLKRTIGQYRQTNKVQAAKFDERLRAVVDRYNSRDDLVFASQVVEDFVDGLSAKIIEILKEMDEDQRSFEDLGISAKEKAFFDILIKVRDDHNFEFSDENCIPLAKQITELVEDKASYAHWYSRSDIKSTLSRDITVLLYRNGYPPQWNKEVFNRVLAQAESFEKYDG